METIVLGIQAIICLSAVLFYFIYNEWLKVNDANKDKCVKLRVSNFLRSATTSVSTKKEGDNITHSKSNGNVVLEEEEEEPEEDKYEEYESSLCLHYPTIIMDDMIDIVNTCDTSSCIIYQLLLMNNGNTVTTTDIYNDGGGGGNHGHHHRHCVEYICRGIMCCNDCWIQIMPKITILLKHVYKHSKQIYHAFNNKAITKPQKYQIAMDFMNDQTTLNHFNFMLQLLSNPHIILKNFVFKYRNIYKYIFKWYLHIFILMFQDFESDLFTKYKYDELPLIHQYHHQFIDQFLMRTVNFWRKGHEKYLLRLSQMIQKDIIANLIKLRRDQRLKLDQCDINTILVPMFFLVYKFQHSLVQIIPVALSTTKLNHHIKWMKKLNDEQERNKLNIKCCSPLCKKRKFKRDFKKTNVKDLNEWRKISHDKRKYVMQKFYKCKGCKLMVYCSRKCQKIHWNSSKVENKHKIQCMNLAHHQHQ